MDRVGRVGGIAESGGLCHVGRDGDLWILEARTRYHSLGKDYANLWLVELDDQGRARGFSEWWKQFPDDDAAGRTDRP